MSPQAHKIAKRPPDGTSTLDKLEEILSTHSNPIFLLAELSTGAELDFLFRLLLWRLVKGGFSYNSAIPPARLLAVAQAAAARGIIPLATPLHLRLTLDSLAVDLRASRAWRPEIPLWWEPLPDTSKLDRLWQNWIVAGGKPLVFPGAKAIRALLNGTDRWLSLVGCIAQPLIHELYQGCEDAFQAKALNLERAGVGARGDVSPSRWDDVRYFHGREYDLLQSTPLLASFIQWVLAELADWLASNLPSQSVHPPASMMLARFPATSSGFAPHLDNPGGRRDNGRAISMVIYLNPAENAPVEGELVLWRPPYKSGDVPTLIIPAVGGSVVLFDSRMIVHQVRPVAEGPARWALVCWLNDGPEKPIFIYPQRKLSLTDALLPIEKPPMFPDCVLFHNLDDDKTSGSISAYQDNWTTEPRVGIVSTVYRAGKGLELWCAHHFGLGFAHIVLIFDRLEDKVERALAHRLRSKFGPEQLTIWSSQFLMEGQWGLTKGADDLAKYGQFARGGGGSMAIPARQTLNAGAALAAARTDALGGTPLDWLLHLDSDELFYLQGQGRGGRTVAEHFSTAANAGWLQIRYANHELLLPTSENSPQFKVNPRLAASRLGSAGWSSLVQYLNIAQSERRPYFNGYLNGKSAVSVAAASKPSGVHGWKLATTTRENMAFLAGPSILHFHLASASAFCRKYLAMDAAPFPNTSTLFSPPAVESAALSVIAEVRGQNANPIEITQALNDLHQRITFFNKEEIAMLEAARLLLKPELQHPLPLQAG